jgi:hypothetical protein
MKLEKKETSRRGVCSRKKFPPAWMAGTSCSRVREAATVWVYESGASEVISPSGKAVILSSSG